MAGTTLWRNLSAARRAGNADRLAARETAPLYIAVLSLYDMLLM